MHIYWFIIKEIIKNVNGQPDEEVHKKRSKRVLSAGVSVL